MGFTILQEHAFASADSACICCAFFELVGNAGTLAEETDVLLATTAEKSCSPTAKMLAARTRLGTMVVVAVSTTVEVVTTRVVMVVAVVESALVVTVLRGVSRSLAYEKYQELTLSEYIRQLWLQAECRDSRCRIL